MARTPAARTALTFTKPDAQTPGFLRRQKQALHFQEVLQTPTAAIIDELVAFLLDYVTQPADRAEATTALLDATQEQFYTMLQAITGTTGGSEPPLVTSER